MKKIIALLLVLVMVLSCFVACSSDDKDDDEDKKEKKTTTEEVKEEDKEDEDKGNKDDGKEPETDAPETDAPEIDAPSVDVSDVAGTYSCTIDANTELPSDWDEDTQALIQMGMSITAIYTLNTDMTCEIHSSIEGLDDMLANLIIYSLTVTAEDAGMTLDELWAQLVEEYGSEDALFEALEEEITPTVEELIGDLGETEFTYSGTFEIVGNTVILSYDGQTEELVIDGDDLIVNENGLSLVLERR